MFDGQSSHDFLPAQLRPKRFQFKQTVINNLYFLAFKSAFIEREENSNVNRLVSPLLEQRALINSCLIVGKLGQGKRCCMWNSDVNMLV